MKTALVNVLLATVATLAACDSGHDGTTAGQKVDQAIASAKEAASEVKQSAKRGLDQAAEATQKTSQVVAKKVDDAAITAAVKAGLAKDAELSALQIDVDTRDGHVSLSGTAPTEAARERATTIARNEKGVSEVDNHLKVQAR